MFGYTAKKEKEKKMVSFAFETLILLTSLLLRADMNESYLHCVFSVSEDPSQDPRQGQVSTFHMQT